MNMQEQRIAEIIRMSIQPEVSASEIVAEFVIIPRDELPEVKDHQDGDIFVGERWFDTLSTAANRRNLAIANLALAEYLAAQEVMAKRSARREELRSELAPDALPFDEGLGGPMRRAIDRIIDLEEAAK